MRPWGRRTAARLSDTRLAGQGRALRLDGGANVTRLGVDRPRKWRGRLVWSTSGSPGGTQSTGLEDCALRWKPASPRRSAHQGARNGARSNTTVGHACARRRHGKHSVGYALFAHNTHTHGALYIYPNPPPARAGGGRGRGGLFRYSIGSCITASVPQYQLTHPSSILEKSPALRFDPYRRIKRQTNLNLFQIIWLSKKYQCSLILVIF